MKYFLIFCLFISFIPAQSQERFIGIKIGPSLTGIHDIGKKKRIGIHFGFDYKHRIKKNILLESGLSYEQKGIEYLDKDQLKIDYLALPLKVGGIIGDKFSGFISLGIIPAYNINATMQTSIYPAQKIEVDIKDAVENWLISGLIEVGFLWNLSNSLALSSDFEFQYGLNDFLDEGKSKHFSYSIGIGCFYRLK